MKSLESSGCPSEAIKLTLRCALDKSFTGVYYPHEKQLVMPSALILKVTDDVSIGTRW